MRRKMIVMKRMLALLLIAALLCGLLATMAFASGDDVLSPESGNTNVSQKETSPQTGEAVSIGLVLAAAVLLCGAAVVTLKKAAAC